MFLLKHTMPPIRAIIILITLAGVYGSFHPSPTIVSLERRQDPTITKNVPTFTFGPRNRHIPSTVANPEPSSDKLQIYPTGIYDDFPEDGVRLAFGPDLRSKIKDTMVKNCKDKAQDECRNALIPVLHNTDVSTHAKRFVLVSAILLGYLVAAVAAEALIIFGEGIYLADSEVPQEVQFDYGDMNQIHDIGSSETIAIQQDSGADPTTITISPAPVQPTPTESEITFETITADSGDRKAGDVVYHIPVDTARRIQDFLGMLGLQDAQKVCEGHNLNNPSKSRIRANTLEECLRQMRQLVPELLDQGPQDLIRVAPQNIPQPPGPGQAIGFPIQNFVLDNVPIIIPVYRVVGIRMEHGGPAAPGPAPPPGFHIPTLIRSSIAFTLVAHALMFAGQMAIEIVVPKSSLLEDVKEDEFVCKKNIICIRDDCKAQEEGKEMLSRNTFCKVGKNEGCKCKKVNYPHHTMVQKGYMDAQYEWLQELIKLADMPPLEPKCDGELQETEGSGDKFKDQITQLCANHAKLQDGLNTNGPNGEQYWTETASEAGFTWSLTWENAKDVCPFDCEEVFLAFSESKDCIKDNGLMKNGEIVTECGKALYNAYKLGDS